MGEQILVVKKQVNEEPMAIKINNTLKEMQKIVGGYIETVPIHILNKEYLLVCNEEGKIKELEINLALPQDNICGDIFITAFEGKDNFRTLNSNELHKIIEWLNAFKY